MSGDIVYKYTVFNKDNWNYNVDKAFFIIFLGIAYATIRMFILNFESTLFELFIRFFIAPFVVVGVIVFIESISAVITKIAFEPGVILESRLLVIPKVFYKTMVQSYLKALEFKQFNFIKEVRIIKNPYITLNNDGIVSLSCGYYGELQITGYVKIPEHFK